MFLLPICGLLPYMGGILWLGDNAYWNFKSQAGVGTGACMGVSMCVCMCEHWRGRGLLRGAMVEGWMTINIATTKGRDAVV